MDLQFNVKFTGEYELFKWIIKKYKQELPYCGEILEFARQNFYSKDLCHSWKYNGIQTRTWNCLHKDLIMGFLTGKIKELKTLQELKEEFDRVR